MSTRTLLFAAPVLLRPQLRPPSSLRPSITLPHRHYIPCNRTIRNPTAILSPSQQSVAIALSLPALPIVAYSEFVLFTTGCGLPAGPSGVIGAAEGVSYLVVGALVLASIFSKVTTGKGLPEGPGKLLGAAEGVAFLLAIVGVGVAGFTAYKYGGLPNAVPSAGSRCFPTE